MRPTARTCLRRAIRAFAPDIVIPSRMRYPTVGDAAAVLGARHVHFNQRATHYGIYGLGADRRHGFLLLVEESGGEELLTRRAIAVCLATHRLLCVIFHPICFPMGHAFVVVAPDSDGDSRCTHTDANVCTHLWHIIDAWRITDGSTTCDIRQIHWILCGVDDVLFI